MLKWCCTVITTLRVKVKKGNYLKKVGIMRTKWVVSFLLQVWGNVTQHNTAW